MKNNVFLMNILVMFSAISCLHATYSPIEDTDPATEQSTTKNNSIRVLVLIIASDDQPVYPELQKIWRAYMHNDPEHVEAYFIRGNPHLSSSYKVEGDILWTPTAESIKPGILNKTILSLEAFLPRIREEFDYILRTNLSSFYVFPKLLEFLKTCPRKNFYGGSDIGHISTIGSGCGFLISPDVAELLVRNKHHFLNNRSDYDDVIIGCFLGSRKIPLVHHKRITFTKLADWQRQRNNLDAFHFRVKNPDHLRLRDDVYIQAQLLNIFYGHN
jgi:hypothetical protein